MQFNSIKNRLFRSQPPKGTEGKCLYAIGDIHGCLEQLKVLLDVIEKDIQQNVDMPTVIVFLGDLIDRGPDSKGVLNLVRDICGLSSKTFKVISLLGNHEESLIQAFDGDPQVAENWIRHGGATTMASYGTKADGLSFMDADSIQHLVRKTIPGKDIAFLKTCNELAIFGDFILVHAGVDPAYKLADQRRNSLLWIREPFLSHKTRLEGRYCVVHGHTISEQVYVSRARIGVDTGAYCNGKLSCVKIDGPHLSSFTTGDRSKNFKHIEV